MCASRAALSAWSRMALVALLALLAVGCAGRADLIRRDLTARELDSLVDGKAARQLLAELLARRSPEQQREARAPSALTIDVVREEGDDPGASPRPQRYCRLSQDWCCA